MFHYICTLGLGRYCFTRLNAVDYLAARFRGIINHIQPSDRLHSRECARGAWCSQVVGLDVHLGILGPVALPTGEPGPGGHEAVHGAERFELLVPETDALVTGRSRVPCRTLGARFEVW